MAAVVVIYGPPGSGKSTLAHRLSEVLGLPCVDRDEFKDLLFETLGYSDRAWSRQIGAASWGLLSLSVQKLMLTGSSFIVETNFRPDDLLVAEIRELVSRYSIHALGINVTAPDEILWERLDARRRAGGRHPGHVGFETLGEFREFLADRPHGPVDFGGPSLTVDTSRTWPEATEIADWIRSAVGSD